VPATDKYREAGYDIGHHGFGQKPAVLVVDLHLAFTAPRYALGRLPLVQVACDNAAALLHVARTNGVPVAKCYTAYGSQRDMPRWKIADVLDHFYYGDPSNTPHPRVHDADYDFTFANNAPSMFFHTPLITFLAKAQVDTVIVTGCTTSGCVRATVVDAFSYGFRVIVPRQCVGDADEGPHNQNLADVERRYADVVDLADAVTYLRNLPG